MSCYCVASAKASADLGQMKVCIEKQSTRNVSYGIHYFFLSSGSKWWCGKSWGVCSPLYCSVCWKPLVQNTFEVEFSEFTWEEHVFAQEAVCQVRQQYYYSPMQKTLVPVKPKSIKEFQAQRIHEKARPAQVYLAKHIWFCKRNTACLQCFWRPGSQKGNPKLTHRLAHNCRR